MDLIKCEPDPCEESYLTCSRNDGQQNDVAQSKIPVLMGVSIMKTENEVMMDFIKSEPFSHGELYILSSCGENGVTDVKEEDPVTIQAMKAEHETVKVDEKLESNCGVQARLTSEPCKGRLAPKKRDSHEWNPGISNDLFSEARSSDTNRLVYLCDVCKRIVSI
jgi:hypothetical protein